MNRDLINKSQDVLDGTRQDEIDLQEISLGKIGSTVLLTRLMVQLKKEFNYKSNYKTNTYYPIHPVIHRNQYILFSFYKNKKIYGFV